MSNEQIFALCAVGVTALVLAGRHFWNLWNRRRRVFTVIHQNKTPAHRPINDIEIIGGSHNHRALGK